MESDFVVYAEGIVCASVCSSLPQAEVEARMAVRDTGLGHGWRLSQEPFRGGVANPCPCDTTPGRTHYLFEC